LIDMLNRITFLQAMGGAAAMPLIVPAQARKELRRTDDPDSTVAR